MLVEAINKTIFYWKDTMNIGTYRRFKPARIERLFTGFIALFFFALSVSAGTLETISPQQAAALVRNGQGSADFVILDVRTPAEYQSGHLAGAVLIDYSAPSFADNLQKLDKSKTYLVYCRSGNRSGRALALFEKLGFQRVYNMAQGVNGWKKAGFTLTTAGK